MHTRRSVLAAAAFAVAGCTGGDTMTDPVSGDAEQNGNLSLTSPAFEDGESIPKRYSRDDDDVNPPLVIDGVPDDTASFVLVVDDPDAVEPAGKVWLHWLVFDIPPDRTEIPEDWTPTAAVVGRNDFGENAYGGPAPPSGTHRYRFKLYALDTTLGLTTSASKADIGDAMTGHVLAQTQLTGTYSA